MRKKLFGSQKGFTLVELLAAIPIMGMLGLAMGAVLIQLQRSDQLTETMAAVRECQVAGDRVSLDGIQAQTLSFGDNLTNSWTMEMSVTGEWTDSNGDYNLRLRDVVYTLEDGDGDGLYDLRRQESTSWRIDTVTENTTTDTVIASHLDAAQMSCGWVADQGDGTDTFAFKIVALVGTHSEERTYNITPRPVD